MTFTEDEVSVAIMRLNGEIIDCSICHKLMLYKYPTMYIVNNNRCCERCNYDVVIPNRMENYNA